MKKSGIFAAYLLAVPILFILLRSAPFQHVNILPNFVIVHIRGDPSGTTSHLNQLVSCIEQIRIFNPSAPIFLFLDGFEATSIPDMLYRETNLLQRNDFPLLEEHQEFKNKSKLDSGYRGGFWSHASERFYYLAGLLHHFSLEDIIFLVRLKGNE